MNERTVITISREYGSGGRELSQILAKKLGVKLYERGTKATQISLTSAGGRILPLIAQSMVSYRRIIKEAERCRGAEERVIKIGYLPLIGTVGENDIIADFYEQHPSKEIDLTSGYSKDLLELVTVGDLDGAGR